jgi:hypothetical protein
MLRAQSRAEILSDKAFATMGRHVCEEEKAEGTVTPPEARALLRSALHLSSSRSGLWYGQALSRVASCGVHVLPGDNG